jgi:hypothetical protein
MVKPIGNLVANLNPNDKVSFKVRSKFESKPAVKGEEAAKAEKKPAKYKTRKKK